MTTNLTIVGLPSSGKTTVFNALSGAEASTGGFSGQDKVNLATVKVPDDRLDTLTELFKPQRRVPADVQYTDIAGLEKGVGDEGISGQLLGHLSQADALVIVVRAFEDDNVAHPELTVDALRDIETMSTEFLFSDLAIVEKRQTRLSEQIPKLRGAEREQSERELRVMGVLHDTLSNDQPIRDVLPTLEAAEAAMLRGFGLLTEKPWLFLVNLGEAQIGSSGDDLVSNAQARFARDGVAVEGLSAQIESEIAQLGSEDTAEFLNDLGITEPSRARVIKRSFDLLGLIPFFTVGEDECRAWTIERGIPAVEAAGKIHTDIQRGFIRAEVISYDDMIEAGDLPSARRAGTMRREGKTYIVQDGDVINFLFNV